MLKTKTFLDVLLESYDRSRGLNQAAGSPSNDYTSGWESTLDAYGMSRIMAQTPRFEFKNPLSAYKRSPSNHSKTSPHVFIESSRPKHSFDETQAYAFYLIRQLVPQLPENFSFNQLKSAYRRAALKTHPDRGGASETFQQVKKSYHILTDLVKNET
jgi:hypothetical protein